MKSDQKRDRALPPNSKGAHLAELKEWLKRVYPDTTDNVQEEQETGHGTFVLLVTHPDAADNDQEEQDEEKEGEK